MPLVLVDRDGVINENRPDYVKRWGEFSFLPGALEGLAALHAAGVRVAVVTNQSAVGRGLLSVEGLELIHGRMCETVCFRGGRIEEILCCPHAPWEGCLCRKPRPGLLLAALAHFGERSDGSFFVGDTVDDLLAAREAGIPFVMVRTGRGREELARLDGQKPPAHVAEDLREACRWILARMAAVRVEAV